MFYDDFKDLHYLATCSQLHWAGAKSREKIGHLCKINPVLSTNI